MWLLEKIKRSHTFSDFTDERVVQADVPAVKDTSLDDGNNDDCKKNVLLYLRYCFWN